MKVPFLDLSLQHRALRTEILDAIAQAYDGTRFCLGRDVEEFELRFAEAFGYPGALGMNSGTSPLHVASLCANAGYGDEIITTPFTFASTAWGISYAGATPVFVDIEESTFNLDPEKIEAAITPKTKAISVVHLFGQPARMTEILALAARRGLAVIEDCAQAVGARYRGRPVGSIGDCGTFSFYPTKNLGACGEGGAFVSRHPAWMAKAKALRVHGSTQRYHHEMMGFNFRMDGFQGAALTIKLRHLTTWTQRRQAIARRYLQEIRVADLILPASPDYGESVYHQFTVRHPRRDALREHLAQCDVGTDLIYPKCLHLQPCYQDLGYRPGMLPIAERAAATCLSLPIFPELTDEQVTHVIACLNSF